jgi:hypothetical protein
MHEVGLAPNGPQLVVERFFPGAHRAAAREWRALRLLRDSVPRHVELAHSAGVDAPPGEATNPEEPDGSITWSCSWDRCITSSKKPTGSTPFASHVGYYETEAC